MCRPNIRLVTIHMYMYVTLGQCSPIGLVPKGSGTGKWRMIVDPAGRSVNDGTVSDLCSLQYTSVDVALQFINSLGRNTVLIKVDLKNAYRMVPIHPANRHLFGIRLAYVLPPSCLRQWQMPLGMP